jgi:hypothetical protein
MMVTMVVMMMMTMVTVMLMMVMMKKNSRKYMDRQMHFQDDLALNQWGIVRLGQVYQWL